MLTYRKKNTKYIDKTWASMRENRNLLHANNKRADKPGYRRILISAFVFVIPFLKRIVVNVAVCEVAIFKLVAVAEQADLNPTWSETANTDFLAAHIISQSHKQEETKQNNHLSLPHRVDWSPAKSAYLKINFLISESKYMSCSGYSLRHIHIYKLMDKNTLQFYAQKYAIFSYFSTKTTYVVGTQKNHFNERVLLSTQNTCLN